MDENTHEFFTVLTEPGTYRVQVTTLSSSGDCEARESAADTGFTFYLSTYTSRTETDLRGGREVNQLLMCCSVIIRHGGKGR